MRQATINSQTVRAVTQKASLTQAAERLPTTTGLSKRVSAKAQSNDDLETQYINYFNRSDISGWDIRKGMGDLAALDLVPDPQIVAAALRACKRINDLSLTTRQDS